MTSILIAEDEPRIASFVAKGLRTHGYDTTVVEDGVSALTGALSAEFDLLVLDLGLPLMDGMRVLERLRESVDAPPVIIVSARVISGDSVPAGAREYLVKPLRFSDLLAAVQRHTQPAAGP